MDKVRVIAEVGSNFNNNWETAKALVRTAKDVGCAAVKFQWIDKDSIESKNNADIYMPGDWVERLLEYGAMVDIPVFFSCFGDVDRKMLRLSELGCRMMKFPFPQRKQIEQIQQALLLFNETIVSTAIMDKWLLPEHDRLVTLYCHSVHGEPVYPVVEQLDFSGLFGPSIYPLDAFTGFSSHCLGIHQVRRAIDSGATVVEVHMKLQATPLHVPDARLSLVPDQVRAIASHARRAPHE